MNDLASEGGGWGGSGTCPLLVVAAEEAVSVAQKALDAAKEEEASFEMKVGQMKAVWEEAKEILDELEKKLKTCLQPVSILGFSR